MKKNAMLKIAAILMVAVLLTTCAISSTFAKYVTSASDEEIARVAKWGVKVDTKLDGIFSTEYAKTAAGAAPNAKSATEEMIVAPGTSGSATFSTAISGTPEVSVKVKNDVTFELSGWTITSGDYMPLIFTINGAEYKIGETYTTVQALLDAINGAADYEEDFAAGKPMAEVTDESGKKLNDYSIKWEWKFDDSSVQDKDKNDTALGNLGTAPTIKITVETSVTQIGEAGTGVATESTPAQQG